MAILFLTPCQTTSNIVKEKNKNKEIAARFYNDVFERNLLSVMMQIGPIPEK